VLCGFHHDVVFWNRKAVEADRKDFEATGGMNFYTAYRQHNHHFVIYGSMFLGQLTPALEAAEELIDTTPVALMRVESPPMADFLEPFIPMKAHVLVRFGRWHDILAEPLPGDAALYCSTRAMWLYAKAVAHSALGNVAEAEEARAAFRAAKAAVPGSRLLHNNRVVDLLEIAEAMLEGELEYRKGNHEAAFAHLRRSVALDDALPYDEPWGWMQPTRHALGALLLEQGRLDEAEAVYRADLGLDETLARACRHPDNLWSLHGLHECLARRGEGVERPHVKARLDLALARAEVPVHASCYCRRTGRAA
jgi:tetratricopeptide (TPR) repeat protein